MKFLFSKKIIFLILIGVGLYFYLNRTQTEVDDDLYHVVERGDFIISIVEGGTLEAVNEVVVKNTIDGESRIISLIPEGTYVKKGDLLVEFDAGEAENKVEEQRVEFESRQAALIKAENDLIITKSTSESEISEAKQDVEFTTMDLEKFEKLERVHKIQESAVKIDLAEEALRLTQERYELSLKLVEKGFETKSKVDQDKLDLDLKTKEFETSKSTFKMLEDFDLKKEYIEFVSKKKEAISKLERVKKQGVSKTTQDLAAVNSAKVTLKIAEDRLKKKKEQLNATKVYAPQDGLVIYAKSDYWGDDTQIAEGTQVRNRRALVKIPDVSSMKVEVKIHESMISQIKKGQKAYIVLDSLPDQRFNGEVTKVAILPDSNRYWSNSTLKVYSAEVVVSEKIEGIKPGVSAKAEIIIEELSDVLTVPIQAVTSADGKQLCYRKNGDETEAIPVEVGKFNTKYIEIKSGLKEGENIILNPPLDDRINLTGEITEE